MCLSRPCTQFVRWRICLALVSRRRACLPPCAEQVAPDQSSWSSVRSSWQCSFLLLLHKHLETMEFRFYRIYAARSIGKESNKVSLKYRSSPCSKELPFHVGYAMDDRRCCAITSARVVPDRSLSIKIAAGFDKPVTVPSKIINPTGRHLLAPAGTQQSDVSPGRTAA